MLKKFSIVKSILLILLLLTGCAGHETKPAVPMSEFNPSSGSFNARVVLFQLDGSGHAQKLESGIVPLEQGIISTLQSIGYHYAPDGNVNYLIEARIGSISPKLLAQGQSEQIGFAIDSEGDWPFFDDYPVLVNEWSPTIQKIRSGPDSCFITMQILIKEVKDQRDTVVYYGTPAPIEVPTVLGCPYSECGQGTNQALSEYMLKLFSPAQHN
jgi:hypothetical protein